MIRVRPQIADRWRIQITKAKTPITILSPYITETRTLTSLKGRQARIYTLFSLKNFASGASDLELLKRLVAAEQHEVYELKELHAKVIMDEDGFVTFGSQNLTARGEQKNLELSICIDGNSLPRTCKRVRDIVKQWIEDAKPITTSRLARMEKDLATEKKLYRDFQRVADELQEKLNTEEEENERERRNLAQRQMRDATRAAVGRLKHAEGNRRATLCKYDSRPPYLGLPPSEESLMNWKCGNRDVSLEPQRRYLCIREDGVLGWARVENKSITVITSSITSGATLKPFPKLELTLYADGSPLMPNVPDDYNVAATLTKCNREVCIVPMRFSFEKLIIGKPVAPSRRKGQRNCSPLPTTQEVMKWISNNNEQFKEFIAREIMEPFDVPPGQKRSGERMDIFVGEHGTACNVRLAFKGEHPIFRIDRIGLESSKLKAAH